MCAKATEIMNHALFGKERERFVKLLGMTHSSSDGEALAAIRKCNDMLTQHKLSWHDVVVSRDPNPNQARPNQARAQTPYEAGQGTRAWRRRDQPSPSRAFEASIRRERYLEQARRNEKAENIRARISNVPLPIRLLCFPVWATAAMLGGTVIPEVSAPMRAMKFVTAALLMAICSVVWFQILQVVVALF